MALKLKAHGIGNDVVNWIEKWLTHRKQRVIVDGDISNWKSVLSGVPQGSVLGPILWHFLGNDVVNIEKWLTHRKQRVINDLFLPQGPYTVFNIYK